MNFHTLRIVLSLSAAAAAAVLVGGCTDADKSMSPTFTNDRFQSDDAARRVDEVFARQAAIADRDDGTFYPQHFTDGRLNSLGYQKLSSMAYGPGGGKLAIYLDVPKGAGYDSAHGSLTAALARGGIATESYTITAGANPNAGGPAVSGLNGLAKQSAGGAADSTAAAPVNPATK